MRRGVRRAALIARQSNNPSTAESKIDNFERALLAVKETCPEYAPIPDAEVYKANVDVWATARLRECPSRIPDLVNCVKRALEQDIQPETIAGVFRSLSTICAEVPEERKRLVREFFVLPQITAILDQFPDCSVLQWRGCKKFLYFCFPANDSTLVDE